MTALVKGMKAPEFTTTDQNGKTVNLSDYKGQKIVLYFYPKDDTPGCTKQACNLRDNMDDLVAKGHKIFGVSVDDEKSHQKFIKKFELNFDLLADTTHDIVEKYGVWVEKNMYGKKYMGTARITFIIDEEGMIEQVIDKVKVEEHAAQIA
jgi:peroxiredoxin Q/BCP